MSLPLLVVLLWSNGILVESDNPHCTVECDRPGCDISDEMSSIKSNEVICLTAHNYTLNNTLVLVSINNVSIIGMGGMATISCNMTVGMVIIDVQKFRMENITLNKCALTGKKWDQEIAPMIQLLLNFSNLYYIPAEVGKSLTIVASHNVILFNVNIQNSTGVGLLALNMLGQSFLLHCTFDSIVDYNCLPNSDELHCISGAALFYLTDANISSNNTLSDNSILIDDCTFQNSISHSNYVALELSDGIFRLNVSLGNNQTVNPLDGSAGLSVIMDRHHDDSRQFITVSNSR